MANKGSQIQREQQLVARLHKLALSGKNTVESRQSDPLVGSSAIKVKDGKKEMTIPLVDGNTSFNRNKF